MKIFVLWEKELSCQLIDPFFLFKILNHAIMLLKSVLLEILAQLRRSMTSISVTPRCFVIEWDD